MKKINQLKVGIIVTIVGCLVLKGCSPKQINRSTQSKYEYTSDMLDCKIGPFIIIEEGDVIKYLIVPTNLIVPNDIEGFKLITLDIYTSNNSLIYQISGYLEEVNRFPIVNNFNVFDLSEHKLKASNEIRLDIRVDISGEESSEIVTIVPHEQK